MLQIVRTLRFKLVVLYFVTFGTIHVAITVVGMELRRRGALEDLDTRLAERAHNIIGGVEIQRSEPRAGEGTNLGLSRGRAAARLNIAPVEMADLYVQLRDDGGSDVLDRSANRGRPV